MVSVWTLLSRLLFECFPLRYESFSLLAQQDPKLPINQLDPPTRTKVVMALLGMVILAMGAMVCIWLAGRYVKRIAKYKKENTQSAVQKRLPSDWDPKKD